MSDMPKIDDREDTTEAGPSRRSFLTRAAGASAPAVPALTLVTSPKARADAKKLTGLAASLINEIMNDEDQHVPILQNLLDDPDNPLPVPIRQPPNFNMQRLRQPNLQAFLETASAFENTGSGLYHGALLNITQTQEYFPTAAGLAAVESRHASWLNSLLGESLVPDFAPVEAPIAQSIVALAGRGIRHRPPVDVPVVRHDRRRPTRITSSSSISSCSWSTSSRRSTTSTSPGSPSSGEPGPLGLVGRSAPGSSPVPVPLDREVGDPVDRASG